GGRCEHGGQRRNLEAEPCKSALAKEWDTADQIDREERQRGKTIVRAEEFAPMMNRFLPTGTKVRYVGTGQPEFGVVIYCWMNEEIMGLYDCYAAFFGDEFPSSSPKYRPYILRYAAQSLDVVSE